MKTACIPLLTLLAFLPSARAATVLADRIVVTNSAINTVSGTVATHWAEVQVFEQGTGTNVAASANGGTASASSIGWGTSFTGPIDGNTAGGFDANNFWHDNDGQGGGAEPDVYTVFFSSPRNVDSFNIWGRSDCCTERDDNFLVEFYNGANLVGSNAASIGGTFNTGVTSINAIPEPATVSAGLLLLGVLSLHRRRA